MASTVLAQVIYDDLSGPSADTAITTHHFRVTNDPPIPTDVDEFVTRFQTFWNGFNASISNQYKVIMIRFFHCHPPLTLPRLTPLVDVPVEFFGAAAANKLPAQCAISVTELTATRKRWGRFYLPGWTEAANESDGRVAASVLTNLANAAGTFYGAMNTAGKPMVVYSRATGNEEVVNSIRVDDVWDIIRRRRASSSHIREDRSWLQ